MYKTMLTFPSKFRNYLRSILFLLFLSGFPFLPVFAGQQHSTFDRSVVGQLTHDGVQAGHILVHAPIQLIRLPFQHKMEFTGGVVALIALSVMDIPMKRTSQSYQSNQTLSGFFNFANHLGDSKKIVFSSFGTYFGGIILQKPELRTIAIECFSAFTVSGMFTTVIKRTSGRYRPFRNKGAYHFIGINADEFAEYSFPSGHSSNVFSIATVLAGHSQNGWIRAGLYSAASATALGRVYKNKHWFSDVFIGSVLGYFSGRIILKLNRTLQ